MLDFIVKNAIDNTEHGIQWYNQQHLADLDFADDIVLIAKTFTELEDLTCGLYDEGSKIGLKVSKQIEDGFFFFLKNFLFFLKLFTIQKPIL